eukprot:6464590-Amphidinium_carterae.1
MGQVPPLSTLFRAGEKWVKNFQGKVVPPGLIPLAQTVDDGRSTLYGIGNAFGTGKTEVAVRSAEATRDVERRT